MTISDGLAPTCCPLDEQIASAETVLYWNLFLHPGRLAKNQCDSFIHLSAVFVPLGRGEPSLASW